MVDKKVEEIIPKPLEEITPEEGKEKSAPTEVETLSSQIKQIQTELEKAQSEAKAHQRIATKATQELSQLKKQAIQPLPALGDDRLVELLLQEKKAKSKELGESDPMIPVLETELAQRKQKALYEAQMRWQEQQITDAQSRCHQQLIEAGYNLDKDEIFDEVDSWISIEAGHRGEFDKVFKRLDKRIGKPKEAQLPKESEEERINRLVDEGVRKKMEEKGLLTIDSGLPSGGGERIFTESEIADMDFFEKNKVAILKAYREGKIKR